MLGSMLYHSTLNSDDIANTGSTQDACPTVG